MKLSTKRSGSLRSPGIRFGIALAVAGVLGAMAMSPAYADDHGRGDRGDRGGHDRGYDRGHWRHGYDRGDWRGNGYYEPYQVYAPPPVYYPPQPSPGISLFFPVHIR